MTRTRWAAAWLGIAALLHAQNAPEFAPLDSAYRALRENRFDDAVDSFRQAAHLAPARANIQKDLGYALLKVGENVEAREAFRSAMLLDPADTQVALEFAFLANDTGQQREARRVFARFRDTNETAAAAFTNIDKPLAEGIARWRAVIDSDPSNFSAHEELARLAETRDDTDLARKEYEAAWRLRPDRRDLLIPLGRLFQESADSEKALTVLLAAAHSPDARIAEQARAHLPERYPYVYEFRTAIAFDPTNIELRRELGFLLIAMGDATAGQRELDAIAPQTLTLKERANETNAENIADTSAPSAADARTMGFRSFDAGYLKDAVNYFTAALERDPLDFEVMLRLAWTYNLLHEDLKAIPWFAMAGKSSDAELAKEAHEAWKRLTPAEQPTQSSFWMFPTFSTRWHTGFGYAQWKTDLKLPFGHLRSYVSTRLVGDSRGSIRTPGYAVPQYLSESSIIPAVGLTTNTWRGARLWAEAGVAWSYLAKKGASRTVPDYRGGLSFVRSYGNLIGAPSTGFFHEHELDALYIHRFNKTFLLNVRNRIGVTIPTSAIRLQLTWNANSSADPRRQYWANFVETGPGLRFRLPFMPPSMLVSADALHGVYTINTDNPRRPNFNDFRLGVWYSISR